MHGAQVTDWASPPAYGPLPDLPAPSASQLRLKILAVAVHRLVQMRASGKHYSTATLPVDPSSDAVGIDEATGQQYYLNMFAAPYMAEYVNIEKSKTTPIPAGADPITVAALVNPVNSSWMSLKSRVTDLPPNFSVLIIGATGTSGRAAVDVVRHLGAGKIIGVGRNEGALKKIDGLDGYIVQKANFADSDFASIGHVDVILDYIYGDVAAAVLGAVKPDVGKEVQYVNIGTMGSTTLALDPAVLRGKSVRMTGSGPGAYTLEAATKEAEGIVKFVATMARPVDVFEKPLSEVGSVWDTEDARKKRLVLVP